MKTSAYKIIDLETQEVVKEGFLTVDGHSDAMHRLCERHALSREWTASPEKFHSLGRVYNLEIDGELFDG